MSIIVSNCQHCNEQQFPILSCIHYTIFSVVKLDLFIRLLLLDCILQGKNYTCASRTSCYIRECIYNWWWWYVGSVYIVLCYYLYMLMYLYVFDNFSNKIFLVKKLSKVPRLGECFELCLKLQDGYINI